MCVRGGLQSALSCSLSQCTRRWTVWATGIWPHVIFHNRRGVESAHGCAVQRGGDCEHVYQSDLSTTGKQASHAILWDKKRMSTGHTKLLLCVALSPPNSQHACLTIMGSPRLVWSFVAIRCHSHALPCCSCTLRVEMCSSAVACLRMITRIALHVDIKLPVVQTRSAPE